MQPRDYQDCGINALFQFFVENPGDRHPLLLYPTGTGKSIVIAETIRRALAGWAETRIMVLAPSKELISQNYEKLKAVWPEAPAGIYCAALKRKEHYFPITIASIESVFHIPEVFGYIDFVIVDEAHEISPSDETMYRKFFTGLALGNPDIKYVGTTATGYRMKQGSLIEGENRLFTDIAFDATDMDAFNWFFDEGYLVPPVPKPTKHQIDASSVRIRGGDYDQKQLQENADKPSVNRAAVLEILEYGETRNAGLIFATGVDHCVHLWEIFEELVPGQATWVASRGLSPAERDRRIAAFRDGEYKYMINNGILTTGFDMPMLDLIAVLRHMMSPGLWVQILGRGTRPYYADDYDLQTTEGRLAAIAASTKQNCLVLDFCENTKRLGPINDPRVPNPRKKGTGDAPIKICELDDGGCGCYNHASARFCWNCGTEFPRGNKVLATAGTAALVKKKEGLVLPQTAVVQVDHVTYKLHRKKGRPNSVQVSYHCGVRVFSEWVCPEHTAAATGGTGFASEHAKRWWKKRTKEIPPPLTAADWAELAPGLIQPVAIKAVINLPNGEIKDYVFEQSDAA